MYVFVWCKQLFFDDSIRNLQTAKNLGLHTVWVSWIKMFLIYKKSHILSRIYMFIILWNGRRWDPLIGLMEWIMHSRAFTMSEKHCLNSGKLLESPLKLPIPKKLQLKHMLELNIMQCSSLRHQPTCMNLVSLQPFTFVSSIKIM